MGAPRPKIGERLRLFAFLMKLAASLRLFALFVHSTPENCGTSQAICIFEKAHDEIGRESQALRTPFPKIAERLRLSAPP